LYSNRYLICEYTIIQRLIQQVFPVFSVSVVTRTEICTLGKCSAPRSKAEQLATEFQLWS